ncbi:hypothetical protein [Streptomyces sp. NPDC059009]|uniref:hypothetical protein n=1 Tax=Streptomyces sp. NPDC059009 TaxID=3346694 RepID=UPI00368B9C10
MDKKIYGRIRALYLTVLALSVATLVAAGIVGGSDALWIRGTIVAVISAVLVLLAKRAFRGSRGAYVRMRLMTAVAPLGVLLVLGLPIDGFPAWMKAEQVAVGVLLAVAAIPLWRRTVRHAYPKTAPSAR